MIENGTEVDAGRFSLPSRQGVEMFAGRVRWPFYPRIDTLGRTKGAGDFGVGEDFIICRLRAGSRG